MGQTDHRDCDAFELDSDRLRFSLFVGNAGNFREDVNAPGDHADLHEIFSIDCNMSKVSGSNVAVSRDRFIKFKQLTL